VERVYLPPASTLHVQVSPKAEEVADVPLPSSRGSVSDPHKYGSSYGNTVFVPVAPSREKSGLPASQEHVAQRLQDRGLDLYQPMTPREGFRFPSAGKWCLYAFHDQLPGLYSEDVLELFRKKTICPNVKKQIRVVTATGMHVFLHISRETHFLLCNLLCMLLQVLWCGMGSGRSRSMFISHFTWSEGGVKTKFHAYL
jgi:hypothetical protein